MKLDQLNQKLIAAARRNPPSDHVPYAFEKRIMAHLARSPKADTLGFWAQALFRSAIATSAIALLLCIGTTYLPTTETPSVTAASAELSQDFQETLLAAVDVNEMADLNNPASEDADFTDSFEELL